MRRGDYMIHAYIEQGKEFKGSDDTANPMVEICCLGQKKYGSAKKNITQLSEVSWMEHIFMEPKNVEKQDAEDAQIVIRVLDKGIFKDELIGQFEFNLSYIYFKKDHIMQHQWVAISNPNGEDYSTITGYIKLSISVVCTGDEQVQITDEDGMEEDTNIMMPPQLNPKFYQLKFRFF